MTYCKPYSVTKLKRPSVSRVLVLQLFVTLITASFGFVFQSAVGLGILMGGFISICGQAFYDYRALLNFGDLDVLKVIRTTYRAMWGKWLIYISLSLLIIFQFKQINAGALYMSLATIHIIGALALPVFVKRSA